MSIPDSPTARGWRVGQSIASELDTALTLITDTTQPDLLPDYLASLWQAVPADWRVEITGLLGQEHGAVNLISEAAAWAGVLFDDDYARVTLAVRALTAAAAQEAIAPAAAARGETADGTLPPGEQLVDLAMRFTARLYQEIGLEMPQGGLLARQRQHDLQRVMRILRDGDLSVRFWHWLDRFFYEVYRPWRAGRSLAVDFAAQHATRALGAQQNVERAPALEWLPAQNPLLRYPELRDVVVQKQRHVFFWAEPFGLADSWMVQPETLAVSFAEPGGLYAGFTATANSLANRIHALSDPTRLIILRLIRHFGMINTEIAGFMQLARPTVSVHAKILREAGFIRSTQQGREMRHELVPGEMECLFEELGRFLDLPPEA